MARFCGSLRVPGAPLCMPCRNSPSRVRSTCISKSGKRVGARTFRLLLTTKRWSKQAASSSWPCLLLILIDHYLNNTVMNYDNYDLLTGQLKNLGFGESDELRNGLEAMMKEGAKEFTLSTRGQFKNALGEHATPVESTLFFRKSDKQEIYFFNSYQATIHAGNPEEERSQRFYINRGHGVTQKEALN